MSVRGFGKSKAGQTIALIIVFSFMPIYSWVLNGSVYSEVALYFGAAREITTLFSGLAVLGMAIIAQQRPSWLDKRLMMVITIACSVASTCILLLAIPQGNALFTIIGFAISYTAHGWAILVVALSLCSLGSAHSSTLAIALGYALGVVVTMVAPQPGLEAGIAFCCLEDLAMIVLLYRMSAPVVDRIATGTAAADLEVSNPGSFLSPIHPFFLCVLLVSFAHGYGLTINEVEHAPVSTGFIGVALIAMALWLVFGKEKGKADLLFSFSALLIVAGFLIAPFTLLSGLPSANAILRVGILMFDILLWMVYAAIGSRNIYALLPTVGISRCAESLGIDVGAILGHSSNELVVENEQFAAFLAIAAAFVFVAFLWLGFRKFSFDATIAGVGFLGGEAGLDHAPTGEEASTNQQADEIERCCHEIGEGKGLTEREIEVFAMLARGRNAKFLREHYLVSRNTVKSHIRHIYLKLDIHSQQELIDLVELCRK